MTEQRFKATETPGVFYDTQNDGFYYEDLIDFELTGIFDTEEDAAERLVEVASNLTW